MTRQRRLDDLTPTALMIEYYRQRASVPGTLLIGEATGASERSAGRPYTPGLFTEAQIEAWKPITKAVHDEGSFIYVQLWMTGRAVRPDAVERGAWVVAPSAIALDETAAKPRSLTEEEILQLIDDHRVAALKAVEAGFDGVEIHGANGYLIDQFTQDVSNQRNDAWGDTIEKRTRFGIEIAKVVADAIGADRTGYRVSPWCKHPSMGMKDPIPQFTYLVEQLKQLNLAYLHIIEARVKGNDDFEGAQSSESIQFLIDAWADTSPVIVAGGYNGERARKAADGIYGQDVLVAFGRQYVSNPDLPLRIEHNLPLAKYDRSLFYTNTAEGYTDYPFVQDSSIVSVA